MTWMEVFLTKAGRQSEASFLGLIESEEAGDSPGLPKLLYTGAGLWSPGPSASPVPEAEMQLLPSPHQTLQEH